MVAAHICEETWSRLLYLTPPNEIRPLTLMKSLLKKFFLTLMATFLSFFLLKRLEEKQILIVWVNGERIVTETNRSSPSNVQPTSILYFYRRFWHSFKRFIDLVLLNLNIARSPFLCEDFHSHFFQLLQVKTYNSYRLMMFEGFLLHC